LKKKQKQLQWRKEDSLRWKKRAEVYEEKENEDSNKTHEAFEPEQPCGYEQRQEQKASFTDVQKQCEEEGVHLLPEILNVKDTCTLLKSLSGVDRVAVQDAISSCRRERDKALNDALCYRNLAERLLVEKRAMKVRMEKRIETVRDFWRNQIFKGQSRSGRIVKAASKRQCKRNTFPCNTGI